MLRKKRKMKSRRTRSQKKRKKKAKKPRVKKSKGKRRLKPMLKLTSGSVLSIRNASHCVSVPLDDDTFDMTSRCRWERTLFKNNSCPTSYIFVFFTCN